MILQSTDPDDIYLGLLALSFNPVRFLRAVPAGPVVLKRHTVWPHDCCLSVHLALIDSWCCVVPGTPVLPQLPQNISIFYPYISRPRLLSLSFHLSFSIFPCLLDRFFDRFISLTLISPCPMHLSVNFSHCVCSSVPPPHTCFPLKRPQFPCRCNLREYRAMKVLTVEGVDLLCMHLGGREVSPQNHRCSVFK